MAVWRVWQQDVSKASLPAGQPLLGSLDAIPEGRRPSESNRSAITMAPAGRQIVPSYKDATSDMHVSFNEEGGAFSSTGVRVLMHASNARAMGLLREGLAIVMEHGWWLRLVEDLLALGVMVWAVLCIMGVCGWVSCSLAAARLAGSGDDAMVLQSVLQEDESMSVYGLAPSMVGLQRMELLSIALPMSAAYVIISLSQLVSMRIAS